MKIIRQRDLKDCGVCCLLSIIEYYQGYVSLEQLRLSSKTNSEGTTALNLIETSKKYGFDASGIQVETLDDKSLHLPAIAHLKLKNGLMHYVVIYKVTKNKVVLMDPAKGKVVKNKEAFYEEWSKVLLVFYPKGRIPVFKKNNTLQSIFFKILVSEKKLFILIILMSLILMFFTIASSYYFQIMLDAIGNNYYIGYLKLIALIFAVIIIFKLLFSYSRKYLENHLNKNIDVLINANFLSHLYNLPLDVITSRTSGEIMTRVNELTNVKNVFTEVFISCLLDFLLMLASMPLLINISNKLFLILFLIIVLYLIVGIISSKIIFKKAYQNIEYESEFNNYLIEDIKMVNSIKNLNIVNKRLDGLEMTLSKYIADNFKLNNFLNKEINLKDWITEIGFFIINTWGFYLIFHNKLSITELITFNTLLGLFLDPIKNCIDSLPKYNFLKASFNKINDFLNLDLEEKGKTEKLLGNDILIKNLRYSYNKCEYLFNNLSFYIKSGSFVSLNGRSGSGKSTICKLLDKYIMEYDGDILIGGKNLKDISIATIRENITYINQNENLITGTIKDNIILNRNINQEDFQKVCQICQIEEIVSKKVLRYETTISDSGQNISGGEKQRIILARALLKKSEILILDEALSEVDFQLERKIMEQIKTYFPLQTILYITHKKHENIFDYIINLRGKNELS